MDWLVVLTILKKYESMGRIIRYIMENKKMFETTNQMGIYEDAYVHNIYIYIDNSIRMY